MGKGPDPKTMKFMIEETKAMLDREAERLKRTLPIDAPITSPLLSYDQLRFICFSSITVFSLTREHNQVFKDSWCTWDFQAPYICVTWHMTRSMRMSRKAWVNLHRSLWILCTSNINDSTSSDSIFILRMWGSSTTISGSVTIHPASQMPQQITPFIFGRKVFTFFLRIVSYTLNRPPSSSTCSRSIRHCP